MGNDDLFSFQSRVIFGAAVHRAVMLHSSPHLITVYSDVDIVTRKGGTHDTLKLWPQDEKKININPQNFIKETLEEKSVANISVAGPVNIQEFKDRHVRFLVSVNIQTGTPEQRHRLLYQMEKKIKELKIEEIDRSGDSILFAFKTIEESVGLAWGILQFKSFQQIIKISLHAGPVYSEPGVSSITGPACDVVRAINEFAMPGKVYSSFQFASVLALQGDKYAVEYAGIISLTDVRVTPIFQVNRHADAFDLI